MERFHLWSLFLQLLVTLYPSDIVSKRVALVLQDAAKDPNLQIEQFAKLMQFSDSLLGR